MRYRIEKQILIDDPSYGALGDDFSFKEIEAIDIVIKKIEAVLSEKSTSESIYGIICYQIDLLKDKSLIYCYDEFLGEESTNELHKMFTEYKEIISSSDKKSILPSQ